MNDNRLGSDPLRFLKTGDADASLTVGEAKTAPKTPEASVTSAASVASIASPDSETPDANETPKTSDRPDKHDKKRKKHERDETGDRADKHAATAEEKKNKVQEEKHKGKEEKHKGKEKKHKAERDDKKKHGKKDDKARKQDETPMSAPDENAVEAGVARTEALAEQTSETAGPSPLPAAQPAPRHAPTLRIDGGTGTPETPASRSAKPEQAPSTMPSPAPQGESLHERALEMCPTPMAAFDAEGALLYANPSFAALGRQVPGDLLDDLWEELFPGTDILHALGFGPAPARLRTPLGLLDVSLTAVSEDGTPVRGWFVYLRETREDAERPGLFPLPDTALDRKGAKTVLKALRKYRKFAESTPLYPAPDFQPVRVRAFVTECVERLCRKFEIKPSRLTCTVFGPDTPLDRETGDFLCAMNYALLYAILKKYGKKAEGTSLAVEFRRAEGGHSLTLREEEDQLMRKLELDGSEKNPLTFVDETVTARGGSLSVVRLSSTGVHLFLPMAGNATGTNGPNEAA